MKGKGEGEKGGVIFEERKGGERAGRKGKCRNITEQKYLSFTLKYLRKNNIYSSADKESLDHMGTDGWNTGSGIYIKIIRIYR